jgi:oxygen-independent coproporphyrinogen-3 oxidase
MLGLYLHIPFCKQACSYCDFYFVTRQQQRKDFVDALIREIQSYENEPVSKQAVQSIYLGGGTPSLLHGDELKRIFEAIHKNFHTADLLEVTMEVNPDDVNRTYLKDLKVLGINRLSMGVQSFNDEVLNFMHRAHNSEHARNCLQMIKESEFDSWSADLIYGNPGQNTDMLKKDIETMLSFEPPHISAYSLTIEDKTRLGKAVSLGKIQPPDDEEVIKHYDLVFDELTKAGLNQYEISNYAQPGSEAVHNSNYWKHVNYLGFGPSAHSFIWDENGNKAYRLNNKRNLKAYLEDPLNVAEEIMELDMMDLAEERIMLSLRTHNGLDPEELKGRYHYVLNEYQLKYIEKMKREGYMEESDILLLTHKGRSIADPITLDIISRQ